jgi:hypothetical protein
MDSLKKPWHLETEREEVMSGVALREIEELNEIKSKIKQKEQEKEHLWATVSKAAAVKPPPVPPPLSAVTPPPLNGAAEQKAMPMQARELYDKGYAAYSAISNVIETGLKTQKWPEDIVSAMAGEMRASAMKLEGERRRNGGNVPFAEKRFKLKSMGPDGEVLSAVYTGHLYIDEKDRCWVSHGRMPNGDIIVSMISFAGGDHLALVREIV